MLTDYSYFFKINILELKYTKNSLEREMISWTTMSLKKSRKMIK